MNHLSLFTGIGGMDLAAERAGFRTVAMCERDDNKRGELAKRWPGVPCFPDVEEVRGSELRGAVGIISGGFPCKDVSVAGRRAGLAGKHSGLWAQFARLIGEVGPKYVLVENVPGLLVRGMGTVLGDLAALGYDAEWDCIPAAAVGAPQLRARIWILAYPRGLRVEADDTLFAGRSELVVRPGWAPEPALPWVDDGLPGWVANAYGDAVCPEAVYPIFRAVARAEGLNRPT